MNRTSDDRRVPADSDRAYEALLAEVDEVRRENARLRGLLGLDARGEDGHAVSWSPTLLTDSSAPPIRSIRRRRGRRRSRCCGRCSAPGPMCTRFAGRVRRAESPVGSQRRRVVGRRARAPRDYLPLTDDVFEAHLAGRETVGIYPLLRGDQCALLACDFDQGTWALDALAYLDACHANGVPAVLERSRSGNGAHVWVFFDGLVAGDRRQGDGRSAVAPGDDRSCRVGSVEL